MPDVICSGCNKTFSKSENRIQTWLKRRNQRHFCSKKCRRELTVKTHTVGCSVCKNYFIKVGMPTDRIKNHYCPNCRGKVEFKCCICGKSYKRYKSAIRFRKRKKNYCSKQCKNVGQRMDWGVITNRASLRLKWVRQFGKAALICVRCKYDKPYNIELHHKIYVVDGGSNNPDNLELLCKNCHGEEHYKVKPDDD